jgi:N-acetylglutamate synthase-like GNAT family acetyltransferase
VRLVEYLIRPALIGDSRPIRDLIHQVGINPMGLDWPRFLVAVTPEGKVIGCGQIKPHGAEIRELASIAVDSGYRGNGIARMIITSLLSNSPMPIYLMCRSALGPFYTKFGFSPSELIDMPAYFRRMTRLANVFSNLTRDMDKLLVMKRN